MAHIGKNKILALIHFANVRGQSAGSHPHHFADVPNRSVRTRFRYRWEEPGSRASASSVHQNVLVHVASLEVVHFRQIFDANNLVILRAVRVPNLSDFIGVNVSGQSVVRRAIYPAKSRVGEEVFVLVVQVVDRSLSRRNSLVDVPKQLRLRNKIFIDNIAIILELCLQVTVSEKLHSVILTPLK